MIKKNLNCFETAVLIVMKVSDDIGFLERTVEKACQENTSLEIF